MASILSEKDEKKDREDRKLSKDSSSILMSSEDLDPIVDTMEAGVFAYISSVLTELYKTNHVK